jgi:hypothetical protein
VFKQNLHSVHFLVRSQALDQEEQKGGRSFNKKYLPVFLDSKHITVCIINFFKRLLIGNNNLAMGKPGSLPPVILISLDSGFSVLLIVIHIRFFLSQHSSFETLSSSGLSKTNGAARKIQSWIKTGIYC